LHQVKIFSDGFDRLPQALPTVAGTVISGSGTGGAAGCDPLGQPKMGGLKPVDIPAQNFLRCADVTALLIAMAPCRSKYP
jgi:hypothetical protein